MDSSINNSTDQLDETNNSSQKSIEETNETTTDDYGFKDLDYYKFHYDTYKLRKEEYDKFCQKDKEKIYCYMMEECIKDLDPKLKNPKILNEIIGSTNLFKRVEFLEGIVVDTIRKVVHPMIDKVILNRKTFLILLVLKNLIM
jgi:hypothetical protein